MHAGAPDVATGLTGQGVIGGSDQDLGAEGEQEAEDTVAQIVELPAGLAEEAVKRAVVFVLAELGGLDDAGEGATAGAQDPGTAQAPKGVEAGLGKAGLEGGQQLGEGVHQQMGHRRQAPGARKYLSHIVTKDKETKTMRRSPGAHRGLAPLPFFQQLLVNLGDLLEPVLYLGKAANALFHLRFEFLRDGDLPHPAVALTDGKDPNRAVTLAAGFLAKAAARFVAADHATH